MQLFHHLIVLFVSLAVAQNLPNIPACAVSCLVTALQGDGCPSIADFACHCQKPELVPKVTPCVAKACPLAEQSSVSRVVVSACSSAGHPISVPNPGASSTPQATTTTTATTTSTGTRASPTGSMTIPTVSTHVSSSPKPSSSAASSSHVSSSPGASTRTGGASPSGTATTSSATPPLKTNGAAQVTGGFIGMAVAAVAAYYHL
ncbi:GPI anchored CFEM domain protein [Aspergillus bombycis]|uniref:GPI anchored CFEM domain protein n=1 Tax=Aspergillus bombycis TaxID=109264 RepID=A0A1F8AI47_9EURO|nr:GPI anchored CFEM domain protein [Aspergillus bombycis]OGM50978.1 GPI anchored CFEM domain protein [Aspergillus bombycis]